MRSAVFVLLLVVMPSAYGQQADKMESSDGLLTLCQALVRYIDGDRTASTVDANGCMGYVLGFMDGVATERTNAKFICFPAKVTLAQAARVIVKHLQDHPNTLQRSRVQGMEEALVRAYPCRK